MDTVVSRMPLSEERKGENEAFFRELNERLENRAIEQEPGAGRSFHAVCECALEACTVRVSISLTEYEYVRAASARFIVARGHADAEVEAVVKSTAGYGVVEKFGEVAQVAQRLDSRGGE